MICAGHNTSGAYPITNNVFNWYWRNWENHGNLNIKNIIYYTVSENNVYVLNCIHTHCGSTLAVASSSTSILLFLIMARARHKSWRCPTLKLDPPSDTLWLSPAGSSFTTCFSSTSSSAAHNAASGNSPNGSRFSLNIPENNAGSCGIMEILDRRSWSPIRKVLTPSTCIRPEKGSMRRKRAMMREDLPDPVRPTIPTCK